MKHKVAHTNKLPWKSSLLWSLNKRLALVWLGRSVTNAASAAATTSPTCFSTSLQTYMPERGMLQKRHIVRSQCLSLYVCVCFLTRVCICWHASLEGEPERAPVDVALKLVSISASLTVHKGLYQHELPKASHTAQCLGQGPAGALIKVYVVWVTMCSDFLCLNVNNTNKYTRVYWFDSLHISIYLCVPVLRIKVVQVSWMCICVSENIKSELTVGLESLCSLPTFKAVTRSENQFSILQYFQ